MLKFEPYPNACPFCDSDKMSASVRKFLAESKEKQDVECIEWIFGIVGYERKIIALKVKKDGRLTDLDLPQPIVQFRDINSGEIFLVFDDEFEALKNNINKNDIYNLDEKNYPNWRGAEFRSVQVFECWICGTLSNKVIVAGFPGYGVRVLCPQRMESWHIKLAQEKPNWPEHDPNSQIKNTLQIKNDLVGEYDIKKKHWMTNV